MANSADRYDFENIRKCSNVEDRLICSQKSYDTKGFVYFPSKQELFVFENCTTVTNLYIYKTSGYVIGKNKKGQEVYSFQEAEKIESFICDKEKTVHRYLDKFGFDKNETLNGMGREFCQEKFNNLLPQK